MWLPFGDNFSNKYKNIRGIAMPTMNSGNITPATGRVTFGPNSDTSPTNIATQSASSDSANSTTDSSTSSSTPVQITGHNIPVTTTGAQGILASVSTGDVINFAFKSLVPGTGITFVTDSDSITINAPDLTGTLATVASTGSYTDLINLPDLARVATSGNYLDLSNKPALSTVAYTGSYTDLLNLPDGGAGQVNSDWNATSGLAQILNKPVLATVATSGSYTDLINTPVLSTVATTGNYSDLLNIPTFATVATTGSYTDLLNTPTPYSLPIASSSSLGGVMVGNGLVVDENGVLSINSSSGGIVQSVALALPSIFAVSGSPVTNTGTLTATFLGQNAKTFFAGPASGSANIPSFRFIASGDLPAATSGSLGAVVVGDGLSVTAGGVLSAVMTSFDGRTGDVVMQSSDLIVPYVEGSTNPNQGAFLLDSPRFTGTPTAPTPTAGDSSTTLATTEFVSDAINDYNLPIATTNSLGGVIIENGLTVDVHGNLSANMLSFEGRVGAIVLQSNDLIVPYVEGSENPDQGAFLLPSPRFLGTPTAVTPAAGDNSTALATTAFVQTTLAQSGVLSFNNRTGAVTFTAADLTAVGGAFLNSPAFVGAPTAPTPSLSDSSTAIATTAFVQTLLSGNSQGGGSGQPTGFAPLYSPAFAGNPTAPTPANSDDSTAIATTAFVQGLIASSGVATFNGRNGTVTLEASDLVVPFVEGVSNPDAGGFLLDSPRFTGVPTADTATLGTSTSQLATTSFVQAAVSNAFCPTATTTTLGGVIVGNGLTVTGNGTLNAKVTSVAGRIGDVTLSVADVTGAAPLAGPAFTGVPTAPTAASGDSTTTLATTAFVQTAINGSSTVNIGTTGTDATGGGIPATASGMPIIELVGNLQQDTTVSLPSSGRWSIFNATSGAFSVTLSTGTGPTLDLPQGATVEVIALGGVYLANQMGTTRPGNDSTKFLATTEYVSNAIGQFSSGVASFNTRTGAIVLSSADVSGVGGAMLASPAFTGIPTAPTAAFGNNTNQLATTAFVTSNFAPLISPALSGAPTAPDIGSQNGTSSGIVTVNYANGTFAPLISPALTGAPTSPTPSLGDSSTKIATTAFVERYLSNVVNVPVSNANITLLPAQYGCEVIEFNGTLTASVIITVPASGQWMLYNNTTGSFNVTISNGQGATYVVPQDQSAVVLSLGSLGVINANIAGNFITPATVSTIGGVIVPNGGGLAIDNSGNLTMGIGSSSGIGGVSQGAGVSIDSNGVLSANVLTVAGRTGNVTLSTGDIAGIANYATVASPGFTGIPTVPTATAGTNTVQIASTAFVNNAVTTAVNTAVSNIETPATVTLGSANVSLNATQQLAQVIILQGTLGANVSVTLPASGQWTIYNTATGGYTVTLTNDVGSTLIMPQGIACTVLANPTAGVIQVQTATQNAARIGVNIQGNPLVTSETFYQVVSPFTLPVNFVGSNARGNFGSGTTSTVNVMQYFAASPSTAVQIGTITFTNGSAPVFTTVGGAAVTFSAGDTLSYQFPTANLSLFASTLVGIWD
jgi:hypothetical protein